MLAHRLAGGTKGAAAAQEPSNHPRRVSRKRRRCYNEEGWLPGGTCGLDLRRHSGARRPPRLTASRVLGRAPAELPLLPKSTGKELRRRCPPGLPGFQCPGAPGCGGAGRARPYRRACPTGGGGRGRGRCRRKAAGGGRTPAAGQGQAGNGTIAAPASFGTGKGTHDGAIPVPRLPQVKKRSWCRGSAGISGSVPEPIGVCRLRFSASGFPGRRFCNWPTFPQVSLRPGASESC